MKSFDYTISIGHVGEQLTLNQWVLGSSPRWCTRNSLTQCAGLFFYCCNPECRGSLCTIGDENSCEGDNGKPKTELADYRENTALSGDAA